MALLEVLAIAENEDLILLGEIAAGVFDRIFIKEDEDKRGRQPGEAAQLIAKGIFQVDSNPKSETILNEAEALETALSEAKAGDLVVIFPESVTQAIAAIEQRIPK